MDLYIREISKENHAGSAWGIHDELPSKNNSRNIQSKNGRRISDECNVKGKTSSISIPILKANVYGNDPKAASRDIWGDLI